jgi:hypothetical protein
MGGCNCCFTAGQRPNNQNAKKLMQCANGGFLIFGFNSLGAEKL